MLYLQVRNNQNMSEKCQELFKSEARASAKAFPGGQVRYFAYPLHVADDTMPMHAHKMLCPFNTSTKMPPATQGRNEEGQGGHNSPGAESLWGRHIVPTSPKDLRFKHRGTKSASCPRGHLTSLRPCCYASSRKNCASLAQQCFCSHCIVQNYEAYHY